ncbi:nucleoside/nucleotide kinase family protein [Streptomyces spectabilis]|uniref:Nucleoside/nucleotide kinase family protein n=1 Tax=Streptomyces spectabilis TaxID=68270 RepID=A0A516R7W4_STRST|nr:nucleoside/nucleotide kinase family protein [Streptomyces spectabilis]QDQ11725.1 nucleoside/nucleotide kinase family protein [Streptomyces spectabilis]
MENADHRPDGPYGPDRPDRPDRQDRPDRSDRPGLKALAEDARKLIGAGPRALLGIAGPPGAGKSTLAKALVAEVGADAAYLPLDGFHLSHAQLERLGLTSRKGSEPSFDVLGYVALLRRVLEETAHDVYVPDYDRTLHEPVAARHLVAPTARLVVTEGNYLACDLPGWREARALTAECWYVEAPAETRRNRLVERQLTGGRSPLEARAWVAGNDTPNGELVETSRTRCDRIVSTIGMDMFNYPQ